MEIKMEEFQFMVLTGIGLLVLFEVFYLCYHFIEKRQSARRIFRRWGSKEALSFTKEELAFIKQEASLYDDFLIDDITWNDLDMDTLYARMNASMSSAGDIGLYRLLRCPIFDTEKIQERYALQSWLLEHDEDRNKIRSALYKIGFQGDVSLLSIYKNEEKAVSILFAYGMLIVTLCALFSAFLIPESILFFGLMAVSNYAISYIDRTRMNAQYEQILQLYRYIQALHALDSLSLKGLFLQYPIHAFADKMKKLQRSLLDDLHTGDSGILYVIAHFFYGEIISYHRLYKKMRQYEPAMKQIIMMLQELDALQSAASYGSLQPVLCAACFDTEVKLEAKEMVHPLLSHPVANDVELHSHVLISGSNASGKSTYLKMIAINCIFAQSFGYAFAKQYLACPFQVCTSMSLKDSLQAKDSYFVAEVRSIQRILKKLDKGLPVLCMIDEILRGTNTIERIAAASEILMSFVKTPSICLSATHDIELTSILSNHYRNMHFQEQVQKDQLSFDYHLYEGAGSTHNALALLASYGYDERLVKQARALQRGYEKNGCWKQIEEEVISYGI